ncbi:hypothetical protein Bca101_057851 [Brassica carinata]
MVIDRWDPGIDTESRIRLGLHGHQQNDGKGMILNQKRDLERGSSPDLERTMEEEMEDREASVGRSCIDQFWFGKSVIIKTKSQCYRGKSDDYFILKSRNCDGEITKDLLDLITSALWKVRGWLPFCLGFQSIYSQISSRDMIRKIKSGNYEGISLLGKMANWNRYKKEASYDLQSITLITISHYQTTKTFLCFSLSSLMAQSQLVGKNGDLKNGDGARQRLRISVPHFDNTEIIKNYSKTLVGRCMNPAEQNMAALVTNLPKIWNLEDRVVGADLGHGRFQFDFDTEEDIEEVLKNQPYHFDYWMLSLARWQPKKSHNYPSDITFWIRVVGVPLDYWGRPSFETIGDAIGKTVEVDLDFGRIKVVIDGFKDLVFDTTVDFTGGEFHEGQEEWVSLEYEKLFGYCETCYSLCHSTDKCPLTRKSPVVKQPHKTDDSRGHDARARSYRGVVINGNKGHQERERGSKDYYGKGKGKMTEETNSRWTKWDGEGSRRRGPIREHQQAFSQDTRDQGNRKTRERSPRQENKAKEQEDGEIQDKELRVTQVNKKTNQEPPSRAFQEALLETQAEPTKVQLQSIGLDVGMEMTKDLNKDRSAEISILEDRMDLDAVIEGKEWAEEDFQDLTEEELEAEEEGQTELLATAKEEKQSTLKEGKERALGDAGKKQGIHRGAFVAGGSTKMRMVQTMLANPKKNAAKTGTRRGEGSKKGEEKGPSHPNPVLPKP